MPKPQIGSIAILGFSPREEVIIEYVKGQTPDVEVHLFVSGQNKALEERADFIHPISLDNIDKDIVQPLKDLSPDIVIIGPDKFSLAGVREAIEELSLPIVGADSSQMQVEASKAFLRLHSSKLGQYYPPHLILKEYDQQAVLDFFQEYPNHVVKYDGIYPVVGGGVRASGLHLLSVDESIDYVRFSLDECNAVVLEQQIKGFDFTVHALSGQDGSIFFFPETAGYKLRNDYDTGPNTSGTGAYSIASGLPFLDSKEKAFARSVVREVVSWMNSHFDKPFIGGLNVDFRKADDGSVYLLEVNTRFAGASALAPAFRLCRNNLVNLFYRAVQNSLADFAEEVYPECSVAVFAFPRFWPDGEESGIPVVIPRASDLPAEVRMYTGWVEVIEERLEGRKAILKQSTTLLFEAMAPTIEQARQIVYRELAKLPDAFEYRKDVGLF